MVRAEREYVGERRGRGNEEREGGEKGRGKGEIKKVKPKDFTFAQSG
ncbi:MAG: hypothetical protein K2J48_10290 [Muribaculaceae bacterium]|nr:hypothetical protein [Muribaculaceae bacterium]